MRGKKSTDQQKKLSGTARRDRMTGDLGVTKLFELPDPPDYLSDTSKEFYSNITTQSMMKLGILNEFTLLSWVLGCQLIGIWIDFSKENMTIKKMSNDMHAYRIARDSLSNAIVILKEFGMTPLSITRIASIIKDNRGDDEYEKFLNG